MIGEVKIVAFPTAPSGWLPCDGQLLPSADYPALYSLIGTTYGGDAASFALPDLRGRMPMHAGTGPGLSARPLGQKAGAETVSMTALHNGGHGGHSTGSVKVAADSSGVAVNTGSAASGNSLPVQNMPPYLALNFVICVSE